ncbi:toll/interleukin-1 receptor domain-containing protein [Sorangium sp. So ce854]|uniref:toll/interleukin-1 receptor domain-containing protein n=1 Tax=Sorangium sp. So ce854 TaxID=3133322 RepID=UPI003F62C70E
MIALLRADGGDFVHQMRAEVRAALDTRVAQLGLQPGTDVLVVDETSYPFDLDADMPIAGVYFGASPPSSASVAAAEDLVQRGAYVLPIVPSLAQFASHVPSVLWPINGDAPEPGDQLAERVASRVAEQLGLLRRRRLAFISYKRSESTGVANQLRDALEAQGFEVFLDTYSVEKGVEFQPVLWDRMADADLVILLDTRTAFKSAWVEQEVSNASMMGLAVLQLVWPGHTRTAGTNACDVRYLDASDFEATGPSDPAARLLDVTVAAIASQAEDLRARSFASRRMRLVGEAQRLARTHGLDVIVRKDAGLDVISPDGTRAFLVPLVGHPDAMQLHAAHTNCTSMTPVPVARVLYDPIGMLAAKAKHLGWLNHFLPLKALPLSEVGICLSTWSKAAR